MENINERKIGYAKYFKSLSGFEYKLLPSELRYTYADLLFSNLLKEMRESSQHKAYIKGSIAEIYRPYLMQMATHLKIMSHMMICVR